MSEDILGQAKKHYESARDGWKEINEKALDDQNFLSDEPYAQWDEREAQARIAVNRPVVEIDQLSQFVHQVANDIRQNTPAIHVLPVGDDTDIETAEMIAGRIKAIEYKSNADAAYDMAADFSIRSSLGFIRVDHCYINDKGFEQELRIKRVVNPQAILLDPMSIEPDGSDAKYGFVFEKITVAEFKRKYPDATPISFGEEPSSRIPGEQDELTIAEYYYIIDNDTEHGLLNDGSSEPVVKGKKYKSKRMISKPTVMRCWVSGEDTLTEPSKFPGKYVPLVPVYGEEAWIGGKRNLYSLIRKAKSPAMMYNALKSSETEILFKQQQAPVQAAVGQMRGFENDWQKPDKAMVLYYHQTDASGQPAPAPQRLAPPQVSNGYAQASLDAEANIRKSMGMYNAGIGRRDGDASGVALKQLEMSGDVASLHFADNLNRSVAQVGKIIVCALPEIEDTPRIVSVITKEDEIKSIGINGKMTPDQKRSYDFRTGEYDVRVVAGPSFTTQRQEAGQMYADLIGKMPDLMPIIGDLVFKYQDNPGSQAISSRLKKLVDPKLLDESERDKEQPDMALQQMQQEAQQVIEAAQQQIQQLTQELQAAKADNAVKQADVQVKGDELQLKAAELQLKQQELVMKRDEAAAKNELEYKKMEADIIKTRLASKSAVSPDLAMTDPDLHESGVAPITVVLEQFANQSQQQAQILADSLQQIAAVQANQAEQQSQSMAMLAQAINTPKQVVRDKDGNLIGVR
jgi:hypothetical protein